MPLDCVIAGAGPSACAAAITLKQAGLNVAIISPDTQPAFCVGESLPGAATPLLDRIGISHVEAWLNAQYEGAIEDCSGNVSAWGSEHWQRQDAIQNPQGGGWHIHRAEFNNALIKHAIAMGVQRINDKVSLIEFEQQVWHIRTKTGLQQQSHFLIDATGRASAIAKMLGLKKHHTDQQTAVVAWIQSEQEDAERVTRIKSVNDGWWYSARLPSSTPHSGSIRVVAKFGLKKTIKSLNNDTAFCTALNQSGLLPMTLTPSKMCAPIQLTDASIGQLSQPANELNQFVAIGDAIVSFDPLSSQGMFFALYTGIKAAESMVKKQSGKTQDSAILSPSVGIFDDYYHDVNNVFNAHQKARKRYYASEHRFPRAEFWQSKVR